MELADSEITFSRWQYFTTLFHAVSFLTIWLFASSLFRCRFGSANRLPQCYNMLAYLPGLHSARPSAFVEGGVFETPAHSKLFRESPLCTTVGQTFPLFPTLPACSIVSGFFLPSSSCALRFTRKEGINQYSHSLQSSKSHAMDTPTAYALVSRHHP